MIVEEAQPRGVGGLELALQRLREKLAAEGLFDRERKKPLPPFPRRVGFVTSPTGAAVRDFLEVLARRWQGVEVLVIPTRVQGEGAAEEIAGGIRAANRLATPLDALVVGRGGGSLEDLWSFNEEVVVRAIAASSVPVVSAVGHEIDVTLADLAADVRALTPSEAAERVAPSADDVGQRLRSLGGRLNGAIRRRVAWGRERLTLAAARRPLARPHALLEDRRRRLDELDQAAASAVRRTAERRRSRLATAAAKLDSLSPLSVLSRGYSVTTNAATGDLVRDATDVRSGDRIETRLADGQVVSVVE